MRFQTRVKTALRSALAKHDSIKRPLLELDSRVTMLRHSAASVFPILIQPRTIKMTVAITANCNLRCVGCRYGRDFMPGAQLPMAMVRDLLDDASRLGVNTVRLYGGEPLLHPDLPEMVRHSLSVGIKPYVTTNGVLLKSKFEALYDAGLRTMTLGFYGTGEEYDRYVQRPGRFAEIEKGIAWVRERHGSDFDLQLNFLLMRPSCNLAAVRAAWEFARRYGMSFQVDLIHYSLPYFDEGPDRCLQFREEDRDSVQEVTDELIRLKESGTVQFSEPVVSLRSIPDWLLKGPGMRVPCDAYKMIWVGADGTVQLCYVTFKLGNLHEQRLAAMLYGDAHRAAARDAFDLNCPNCHCERTTRIQKHLPSRRMYGEVPSRA